MHRDMNRRDVLKAAGFAAAGLALSPFAAAQNTVVKIEGSNTIYDPSYGEKYDGALIAKDAQNPDVKIE